MHTSRGDQQQMNDIMNEISLARVLAAWVTISINEIQKIEIQDGKKS
jgi:hypothetical protein